MLKFKCHNFEPKNNNKREINHLVDSTVLYQKDTSEPIPSIHTQRPQTFPKPNRTLLLIPDIAWPCNTIQQGPSLTRQKFVLWPGLQRASSDKSKSSRDTSQLGCVVFVCAFHSSASFGGRLGFLACWGEILFQLREGFHLVLMDFCGESIGWKDYLTRFDAGVRFHSIFFFVKLDETFRC